MLAQRRSRPSSLVAVVLPLVLVLAVSSRPLADQEDAEMTARTRFAAGDYQRALDIYADLYARTLHPTYLRNIGRCYQNMSEPDKAISSFREYLRKAENLDPKTRAEVDGFIREMEDLKAQRRRSPQEIPAGAPPITLVAPPPAPAGRADDSRRVEASLMSEAGRAPDTAPSPLYARWWFWTAIAVVAAGGLATAWVLSSSASPAADTTLGTKPGGF